MDHFRNTTEQPPSYEQVLHSDQQKQQQQQSLHQFSPQVQHRTSDDDREAEQTRSWIHAQAYGLEHQRFRQQASPSITPTPSIPSTPTPTRANTRASPASRTLRDSYSRHASYPPPLQLELALAHASKNGNTKINDQTAQQFTPHDPWESRNAMGVGMAIQRESAVRRTSKPEEEKDKKGSVSISERDIGVPLESVGGGRGPATPNKDILFSPLATNFQLNWQPKPLSELIHAQDHTMDDPFRPGYHLGLTGIIHNRNPQGHDLMSGQSSRKTSDGDTFALEPLSPAIPAPPQPSSISIRQQPGMRLLSQSGKRSGQYAALASPKQNTMGKKRTGSGTDAQQKSPRETLEVNPRIPELACTFSKHSPKDNAPRGVGLLAVPGMALGTNNRSRRGALSTGAWILIDAVDEETGVHETSIVKA